MVEDNDPLCSRDGEEVKCPISGEDDNTKSDPDDGTTSDEDGYITSDGDDYISFYEQRKLEREEGWKQKLEEVDQFLARVRRDAEERKKWWEALKRRESADNARYKQMNEYFSVKAMEARIAALFQHHPEINRFRDIPKRGLPVLADVKLDLEVLDYLRTTRRALLEGLKIPFSDVEKGFEERYKVHPSVFKDDSRRLPKELREAIDLRSDAMRPTKNTPSTEDYDKFWEKAKKECSEIIDSWLKSKEDQPYPAEKARKTIDELYRIRKQINEAIHRKLV